MAGRLGAGAFWERRTHGCPARVSSVTFGVSMAVASRQPHRGTSRAARVFQVGLTPTRRGEGNLARVERVQVIAHRRDPAVAHAEHRGALVLVRIAAHGARPRGPFAFAEAFRPRARPVSPASPRRPSATPRRSARARCASRRARRRARESLERRGRRRRPRAVEGLARAAGELEFGAKGLEDGHGENGCTGNGVGERRRGPNLAQTSPGGSP